MPLRTRPLLVLCLGAVAAAGPAQAQDKMACVEASERAQHLRTDGKLAEARSALITCASEKCPAVVRNDCKAWLGELETARPSVVVSARTAGGRDLADVRVFIDGKPVSERLDGKAIYVDPGSHTFRYEAAGAPPVEDTLLVREGEKSRVVTVTFQTGDGPKEPALHPGPEGGGRSGLPTISYVLGGLGVVATGSFLYFAVSGRSDYSDLRSRCSPECDPHDVSPIRTKLFVADVSLGVAIVSFGLAVVFALTNPRAKSASALPRAVVAF
jgi:hypothetical protein